SLRARIRRTVMNIPDVLGATGEVEFTEGYPSLVNDAALADLAAKVASELLGEGGVVRPTRPSMGVDDFAHFSRRMPGCYFMLGVGHGDGREEASLHSPRFDPDERALAAGAAILARLAVRAGLIYQK
ncbi:MAG: M20/M25/M40 family metallo-hydrolase, partial [Synergistota bacterium]|nr:M20/M25/M40 family metallo-hydrolase [Synergistota bacterium]